VRLGFGVAVDKPSNPVPKHLDVEIDEQADAATREFQIRQELRFVDREQALYGFQFNDHAVFDQQINPIAAVYLNIAR
jgi:cell division protein FtsX